MNDWHFFVRKRHFKPIFSVVRAGWTYCKIYKIRVRCVKWLLTLNERQSLTFADKVSNFLDSSSTEQFYYNLGQLTCSLIKSNSKLWRFFELWRLMIKDWVECAEFKADPTTKYIKHKWFSGLSNFCAFY